MPVQADFPFWLTITAIVAIALLFIGVLSWLGIRQAAKSRDLKHQERMKALELGRATGPSEAESAKISIYTTSSGSVLWMRAGVPIAAISGASFVMIQTHLQDLGIILAMWICVAVISVASVACGTVLMICKVALVF